MQTVNNWYHFELILVGKFGKFFKTLESTFVKEEEFRALGVAIPNSICYT